MLPFIAASAPSIVSLRVTSCQLSSESGFRQKFKKSKLYKDIEAANIQIKGDVKKAGKFLKTGKKQRK